MKLLSTEVLVDLEFLPVRWYGWCDTKSIEVRTHTKDTLDTSNHNRRCGTCQPVYMRSALEWAFRTLCELSVAIWLQLSDLCLVIHGCR